MPRMETKAETKLPVTMRWGGAEDAEGIALEVTLEKNPEFFEINFEENLNLMIEINGHLVL